LKGVTAFDLLLMSKEILGEDEFTSPYQYLAADVNKSSSITLIDIVELKRLILGYNQEFNDGRSWYINATGFNVENYMNSSSPEAYEYVYYIEYLGSEETVIDFVATKKGDVNGSYTSKLNKGVKLRSEVTLL